jgi:hypothetical protein
MAPQPDSVAANTAAASNLKIKIFNGILQTQVFDSNQLMMGLQYRG